MTAEIVALRVDGKWMPASEAQLPAKPKAVAPYSIDASTDDISQIAALLGQVVRVAQGLSEADARRARDLVHATSSMLGAMTYLPRQDQQLFEKSIRDGGRSDEA
jgi:hypothetical protein